jgi:hypothetical protein
MTFENTKHSQEGDLPPDNTHNIKPSAMQPEPTGRVYYPVFQ